MVICIKAFNFHMYGNLLDTLYMYMCVCIISRRQHNYGVMTCNDFPQVMVTNRRYADVAKVRQH